MDGKIPPLRLKVNIHNPNLKKHSTPIIKALERLSVYLKKNKCILSNSPPIIQPFIGKVFIVKRLTKASIGQWQILVHVFFQSPYP